MFGQQECDIVMMVHADDFGSTADIEDLRWLESVLKEKFENHDRHHRTRWRKQEANQSVEPVHLRHRQWVHEPNVRLSEMIVMEIGLQSAKIVSTPVSDMHAPRERRAVDHETFKKCQSLCIRANLLAVGRIDLQGGAVCSRLVYEYSLRACSLF